MNILSLHTRYLLLTAMLCICSKTSLAVSTASQGSGTGFAFLSDSITTVTKDSIGNVSIATDNSLSIQDITNSVDSTINSEKAKTIIKQAKRDWTTWRPDPKRAMWLAIVIPGAGQIYNRKYWKLPIIYGGFVGCAYAMRWNDQMYKDYSQAYLDIMDDDDTTKSYESFMHLGMQITDANKSRYQEIFKSRKDRYRRWRDLSFFCILGVYALSIVDAYVDASLSQFDISDDLSLHIEPGIVSGSRTPNLSRNNTGIGINCSLSF